MTLIIFSGPDYYFFSNQTLVLTLFTRLEDENSNARYICHDIDLACFAKRFLVLMFHNPLDV